MRRLLDRLCRLPTPAHILRLLRCDPAHPQHWQERLARLGRAILEPLLEEYEEAASDGASGGIDAAERFHRALHRVHGFRAGAVLGALLFVILMLVAITYGIRHVGVEGSSGLQSLPGILAALAAVLGTIIALLMAVAVFTLQLHGQRLGRAAFLIQYLTRREGLVPIASFLLVVIGANATVALLAAVWWPHAAVAMGVIDLVLLPLSLPVILRLFCRLVTSVAGDFIQDCVVPGLVWEYERALQAQAAGDVCALRRLLTGLGRLMGIASPSWDEVSSVLSRLGDDEIRTQLLEIVDDQQARALKGVIDLSGDRDRMLAIARLARVVRGRPSADRCEALRARVVEGVRGRRDIAAALGEMGALAETADPLDPPTVSYGSMLSKAFLVGEGSLPVERADELAEQLSRRRAVRLAETAASRAESVDRLADLGDLRDALVRAIGTLASRGRRPSLVLLPEREALIEALSGLPEFKAVASQQADPDLVGGWGGCQVRRWPTGADSPCIVVMDAGAFYGACEPDPGATVTLNFEEHNTDVYERQLADAERGATDVPDAKAVEIVVAAHMPVGVGVRNPHAAVRIDL